MIISKIEFLEKNRFDCTSWGDVVKFSTYTLRLSTWTTGWREDISSHTCLLVYQCLKARTWSARPGPGSWIRRPAVRGAPAPGTPKRPILGRKGNRIKQIIIFKFFGGSLSAESKRNFASKYAFDNISQALQDVHTFTPLQTQHFSKKSV